MTRILYDYFTENNNISIIANIHPNKKYLEETTRVLDYAENAMDIKPMKLKSNLF